MTEKLNFPEVEALSAQLEAMTRGIRESMKGVIKALEPHIPAIMRALQDYKVGEELKAAGWLPHDVIPIELVRDLKGPEEVNRVLENYFTENWSTVEPQLRRRYENVGLDNEALATMDEALRAHGDRLYRCVCRTVFPEIDRMARLRYYGPKGAKGGASLDELRNQLGEMLSWSDFGTHGFWFLHLFEAMMDTCYAHITTDMNPLENPTRHPNRHAIAHGFVSFSTAKDSMNTLFIADFMFHGINALSEAIKAT